MVKNRVLPFLSVILLATLPTASFAQDARAVLAGVVKAMGAENLKTLHYSGSGSSYVITPGPVPATGWPHTYLKSYVRDLNLETFSALHRVGESPQLGRELGVRVNLLHVALGFFGHGVTPGRDSGAEDSAKTR